MMLFHVNQFPDPAERVRQARGFLDFLNEAAGGSNSAYARQQRPAKPERHARRRRVEHGKGIFKRQPAILRESFVLVQILGARSKS